jgi:hypothetical protein
MALESGKYLAELKKRAKDSHVHREFQLIGLEIADILRDRAHKALYIKLAKQHPRPHDLLAIAKEVAEKKDVKRKGAYFMVVVSDKKEEKPRAKSEIFRYSPSAAPSKKKKPVRKKNDRTNAS